MKKRVFIVMGVEVLFGIIEGIIVPNFVLQPLGRGWKFRMPARNVVIRTFTILFITGFISGWIADRVMIAMEQPEDGVTPLPDTGIAATEEAAPAQFLNQISGGLA